MNKNLCDQPCEPSPNSSTFGKIHLLDLPKCGAKRRKREEGCQAPAMANGRCRLHGGLSTGPRTPEGLERSKRGNWKHGERSQETIEERRALKIGFKLLLKPEKLESMSSEEIRTHKEALKRLIEKRKISFPLTDTLK